MPRNRYKVIGREWEPNFMTCGTVSRIPLFADPEFARIVTDSLTYLSETQCIEVHAYVVIPDHLHVIASAHDISHQMNRFKAHTARQIVRRCKVIGNDRLLTGMSLSKRPHMVDQTFQVWEQGFHPKLIFSEEVLEQKRNYIHRNPVRHGLVTRPEDWYNSSYLDYRDGPGRGGPVPITFI